MDDTSRIKHSAADGHRLFKLKVVSSDPEGYKDPAGFQNQQQIYTKQRERHHADKQRRLSCVRLVCVCSSRNESSFFYFGTSERDSSLLGCGRSLPGGLDRSACRDERDPPHRFRVKSSLHQDSSRFWRKAGESQF